MVSARMPRVSDASDPASTMSESLSESLAAAPAGGDDVAGWDLTVFKSASSSDDVRSTLHVEAV